AQAVAVGTAAHRHQHAVGHQGLLLAVALDLDLGALLALLLAQHLGAREDRDAALLERLAQLLGGVGVGGAGDLVEELDDRHLGAERVVDVGELEADGASADHEEALGHLVADGERAGRVDDAALLELEARDAGGARAGGHDERPGGVLLAGHLDLVGAGEAALALDQGDLVAPEEHLHAVGLLADDLLLPRLDAAQVDLRLAEVDAELLGALRAAQLGAHVQQGLGGDAADVEAHAAHVALLDAGHLETELGRADGGVVTAGT